MRPRPGWMGKYDTAILELLEDSRLALSPTMITFNLDFLGVASPAKSTVQRRLGILEDEDMVEKVDLDAGYYAISERGKGYLAGNIDASELKK